jgi:hypothetical protein
MKFTLSLSDYIDQYQTNTADQQDHCPVCYERLLQHDVSVDLRHILKCYKEDLLLHVILQYRQQYNESPEVTSEFVDQVDIRVAQELANYCESHQKLIDLLG